MKYLYHMISLAEVPGEVSLTLAITGCPNNCEGCHSPELRQNIGSELNIDDFLFTHISCVCFLGGDQFHDELIEQLIKAKNKGLKTCLYTGRKFVWPSILKHLDFVKFGPYMKDRGPLTSRTTNQQFFDVETGEDITEIFWKDRDNVT